MAVIRGANVPLVERTIKDQLKKEHKAIAGEIQREPVRAVLHVHVMVVVVVVVPYMCIIPLVAFGQSAVAFLLVEHGKKLTALTRNTTVHRP